MVNYNNPKNNDSKDPSPHRTYHLQDFGSVKSLGSKVRGHIIKFMKKLEFGYIAGYLTQVYSNGFLSCEEYDSMMRELEKKFEVLK